MSIICTRIQGWLKSWIELFVKVFFFIFFFTFHLVLAQLLFCRLKLNREEKWKKLLSLFSISSQREAPYLENDDFSWKKNLIWWCSLCQFCNYLSFQINMHGSIFFSMRIVKMHSVEKLKINSHQKLICQNQHFSNFIRANKIAFTIFDKKFCDGFLYLPHCKVAKWL